MNSFRELVRRALNSKDGKPLYNSSLPHAEILTEALLESAQNTISILSNELNPRVFATRETLDAVRVFLANPDHSLEILIETNDEKKQLRHPFFNHFWTEKDERNNIEIRTVPERLQGSYDFNMIVADSENYRFEPDRGKPSAVAAFGDKDAAINLQKNFNVLWEKSTALPRRKKPRKLSGGEKPEVDQPVNC